MNETIAYSRFCPNKYSNYQLAGNLCNAFVIGEIGDPTDFFLVGAEPSRDTDYPLLTGNFLDSNGNPLFQLERNILTVNPRNCSKIKGDHIGFEIHDGDGNTVFKVETKHQVLAKDYVTAITGVFYGKGGKKIAIAADTLNTIQCKYALGYADGTMKGVICDMTDLEVKMACNCIQSGGVVPQLVTGSVDNKTFEMDGKFLSDVTISKCKVIVRRGDFTIGQGVEFEDNHYTFDGAAGTITKFYEMVKTWQHPRGTGIKCDTTGKYAIKDHEHSHRKTVQTGEEFPPCPICNAAVGWALMGT